MSRGPLSTEAPALRSHPRAANPRTRRSLAKHDVAQVRRAVWPPDGLEASTPMRSPFTQTRRGGPADSAARTQSNSSPCGLHGAGRGARGRVTGLTPSKRGPAARSERISNSSEGPRARGDSGIGWSRSCTPAHTLLSRYPRKVAHQAAYGSQPRTREGTAEGRPYPGSRNRAGVTASAKPSKPPSISTNCRRS